MFLFILLIIKQLFPLFLYFGEFQLFYWIANIRFLTEPISFFDKNLGSPNKTNKALTTSYLQPNIKVHGKFSIIFMFF